MSANKYTGGGLRDGQFKLSDGETYDVEAVVEAGGAIEQTDIEVVGDDERKGTFSSNRIEALTIVANAITFDVIQAITGNSVSSSETGAEVALGTDDELNPPYVEFRAQTTARNSDDESEALITKTWHKVQVKSVLVTQAGETEFKVEMEAIAIPTDEDIESVALDSKRVATLSVQAV